MNGDQAVQAEPAVLRAAFDVDDGGQSKGESTLGWEAVHAFESAHEIVLPEPYRSFVAEIADGSFSGPPAYGLLPVAELPDDWGDDGQDRVLSKPFPLTTAWMWEEDPDRAEDADEILEQVYDHGSTVLGTDGCAMNWHLVVAGPHRGHVWLITDVGAAPFGEQFGFTTGEPGFAGWVRHWAANKPWYDAA
ncbi:SMI1/KNR4 family protein [Streptomyces laculatispora]|uniref:SMI1/KNR4 family protein n=1 Tax=Streptomyces laculatispora TaxID=887464 RepID=A0ABY9HXN6_9ACTN|nr:SMI1/KNR4 family protein [Streptomyces laculatispora]WLQ39335.1 SMI1/KNR4 family protein [Streptomyces laculatispora]